MDRLLDLNVSDISNPSYLYIEAWSVLLFLALVVTKINKNSLVFFNDLWSINVKVRILNERKYITPEFDKFIQVVGVFVVAVTAVVINAVIPIYCLFVCIDEFA